MFGQIWFGFAFIMVAVQLGLGGCAESKNDISTNCIQEFTYPVSAENYRPGSYLNRNFLNPDNHLGEDVALNPGTPVRAIGPGKIVWYGPSYDTDGLTVVIEHELPYSFAFQNGLENTIWIDKFLSIYSNLRKSVLPEDERLLWQVGDRINTGDVIGYVDDQNLREGIGPHLHLATRLGDLSIVLSRDPEHWLRLLDNNGEFRSDFTEPKQTIDMLRCVPSNSQNSAGGGFDVAEQFNYPITGWRPDSCLGWGGLNSAYTMSDGRPGKHLADDYCVTEGTNVTAVANGIVRLARAWSTCPNWGYLIILEHTLPTGQIVHSLYGHCEPTVSEGTAVSIGQTICRVVHLPCWSPHLHFSIYNGNSAATTSIYPSWAAGYMTQSAWPGNYVDPNNFIETHRLISDTGADSGRDAGAEGSLSLTWTAPSGSTPQRVSLSGRIINSSGSNGEWRSVSENSNSNNISANIPLNSCEGFEFSIEYLRNGSPWWSCTGSNTINGTTNAMWNSTNLRLTPVSNGIGGCNIRVNAPCGGDSSGSSSTSVYDAGTSSREDSRGSSGGSSGSGTSTPNTITCMASSSELRLFVHGQISRTLVGGELSPIAFLAIGSNETGWLTQTTPPAFFTPYNGDIYTHVLVAPPTIRRFNLWVGSLAGTRWLNIREWQASESGCRVIDDGLGGYVIQR